jgi:hypothetical protein
MSHIATTMRAVTATPRSSTRPGGSAPRSARAASKPTLKGEAFRAVVPSDRRRVGAVRASGEDDWYGREDGSASSPSSSSYERAGSSGRARRAQADQFRDAERNSFEYAPTRVSGGRPPPGDRYDYDDDVDGGGGGPRKELNKFLIAGAFVIGIGAGVVFDTAVDLEPSNVASREILDRRTPDAELCMANGASAMVFDQRVFLSLNPFNVYVAQPEVKPGCVLRRSNWNLLERKGVVDKKTEDVCKNHMNTFAFVGSLDKSPEVSCVYHSEDAENQFMRDPSKAVLGDGMVNVMRERVDSQSETKRFR